jgi:predicted lipid-binding transport protein (Tim44 family)
MMKTLWLALIAVFATVTIGIADAEAKRLGGGRDVGKQAPSSVTQRQATPPAGPAAAPAAPAQGPAAAAAPRAGAPAAAPAAGSRWMAPIAGLAAGLGLAALASWMGFGQELANIMMIVLLAMVALVVIRMVMARRAQPARPAAYAPGYGYTGLGQEASVPGYTPTPAPVAGRSAAGGVAAPVGSAIAPAASASLPAGFDADGFVRTAKVAFLRLQASFDAGNLADLREFTSPEMYAELKLEIDERAGAANHTEVNGLQATLLGVESTGSEQMASVRFTGSVVEAPGATPEPLDEVWNLTRPLDGGQGWVLAGIQQLSRA